MKTKTLPGLLATRVIAAPGAAPLLAQEPPLQVRQLGAISSAARDSNSLGAPRCFIFAGGLLLMLLLLSGCGSDSSPDGIGPPGDEEIQDDMDPPREDENTPTDPVTLFQEPPFSPDWGHSGAFAGAQTCAPCHRASAAVPGVMEFEGRDVSPFSGWRHSLMAQGFADPYFQAKLIHETETLPHLAGLIEDKCLTCHTPMGRTHDLVHSGAVLEGDHYRLGSALETMYAREAISCTVCHQILPEGLGGASGLSGGYVISPDLRHIHGPFQNPVAGLMLNDVNYTALYGAQMKDSALCATCHTLFTPVVDPDTGEPTGGLFPEQTPYLEWLNSIYSHDDGGLRRCQSCHMPTPAPDYRTLIATRRGDLPPPPPLTEREPFRYHALIGGNTHLLAMLGEFRNVLGLDHSSAEGFSDKLAETRSQLENRAATVEILEPTFTNGLLEIPVRVTNQTGHKLPTGFPSRRMWIHLRVADAEGGVLFESGDVDAAGRISLDAGHTRPGCLASAKEGTAQDYADCYEPHRDVIESSEQVAVYEAVMGDLHQRVTYVLLYANGYLKDNRLPPIGFDRKQLDADATAGVFGLAARDPDFSPDYPDLGSGGDLVRYRVMVGEPSGPVTIEARLLFQSIRPAFAEMLGESQDARVTRFGAMYVQVPPIVEVLARDERLLSPY